jgi:hypothetical protein
LPSAAALPASLEPLLPWMAEVNASHGRHSPEDAPVALDRAVRAAAAFLSLPGGRRFCPRTVAAAALAAYCLPEPSIALAAQLSERPAREVSAALLCMWSARVLGEGVAVA